MDPVEYRQHAQLCRRAAARSTEPIRGDFLAAAAIWDVLAGQAEWLKRVSAEATAGHRNAGRHQARPRPHDSD